MRRTVIFHNHLFKNAGTSVDNLLQLNFGKFWVSREFPANGGDNSSLIEEWIHENPEAIAFSSHTALGPLPEIQGVKIISLVMLRDPIARIFSAYRFERKQNANTWGAKVAKEETLEGYILRRLARRGDRQCRNFQTQRLASMFSGNHGTELSRALMAAREFSIVGTVEKFEKSIIGMEKIINGAGIEFTSIPMKKNVTNSDGREILSDELLNELILSNADDIALHRSVDIFELHQYENNTL